MGTPDNEREERRQHLEFIQAAVGRMFSASNAAKGWCLTVATAALGFALTKDSRSVALLGAFSVALFGILDASYLREERKFRALFEDARKGNVEVYEMATRPYVTKDGDRWNDYCKWPCVMKSWSLWRFYGPLLVVAGAVVLRTWTR